ncbi:D-alanyl-D-alanine carboxypeptidase family protein [Mitsuokella sp.]|uniref:D-alanyl-D-alanine carboxypeptidase family protein n=1 Tax=Mitsuokella sp. TaxID=2049034 RepID=UPI002A8347EC|nr:D-alanyl-D-alanine carboxypeptidase family protein [Mitsuokella sp.]MDY4475194.1 D-alanyl-D-alanine carboxypeptidase family protein [Mitsuokella sp.]
MKKRTAGHLLLAGSIALSFLISPFSQSQAWAEAVYDIKEMPRPDVPGLVIRPDDPLQNLTARSAVVMDAATGQVIYARDMDARRFPASTTKIMTLILALENSNLDDVVTVSSNAAGTEGSTIWLEAGEKLRMGDLLYGMMMHSGNDATVAIAEHIAGSVDKFAVMMTRKAHEIGAVNTNFANANGLPRDDHYTTAYDMALIASYGYKVPGFEEIVSTKEMHFDWVKDPEHRLRNENQMLWLYRGANGVKTGYTDAAGRCLVSAAKKDGLQLVAVVLDSVYMWNDSIKLLDYGFAHVEPVTLVTEGDTVGYVPAAGGNGTRVPLKAAGTITLAKLREGDARQYETRLDVPSKLQAPVAEGDVAGRFVVLLDGKEVASTDLLAGTSITRRSFFLTAWHWLQSLFGHVDSAK